MHEDSPYVIGPQLAPTRLEPAERTSTLPEKEPKIMTRLFLFSMAIGLASDIALAQAPPPPQPQPPKPQPGTAAQIGEKIDRGINQIGAELSQAWADVRKTIEKMGVQ